MDTEKMLVLAGVAAAFLAAVVAIAVVMADSLTNDEHNQLPRCDTSTEVLVGLGDFYNGHWDDYSCIELGDVR